jgi:subtilase family serine protease
LLPSPFAQRRLGFAVFAFIVCLSGFSQLAHAQANAQNRITQAIDENKLTLLKGNTHPLARAEFDRGAAPANLPMQRMLLVLSRTPQQESALQTLLEQQQAQSSPSFHKWLTPDEFGQQFGPSDQDIQTITSWLEANGFQVGGVSRGRGVVEFSGTAGQVQAAFRTAIHRYVVDGAQHWANASDPQIPSALASVVVGVDSLNNFPKMALHHVVGVFAKSKTTKRLKPVSGTRSLSVSNPLYSYICGYNPNTGGQVYCNGVTPYDFATIYNVLPLWTATTPIDGTGQTIAIVARSNINLQDVTNFRSLFGLPANPPQVILDGPDPGLIPGDETEADLDVEWSGAVAKGATIKLVVSESTESTDGVDLSAEYIVDNDLAPIMSESFGDCELFMGTAGNQFYKSLWEQAAAEGISVFVSAGDEGSAACDYFQGSTPQAAKNGLQVSGIASTPYNVAVGGTDFNDFFNPLTYWNTANNSTTQQSAKGNIPETTWNDSCTNAIFGNPQIGFSTNAETNCNNYQLSGVVDTIGGSGGKSGCTTPSGTSPGTCSGGYLKPAWQTGSGVPADNKRDLPDVSLFASDGFLNNFYVICEADSTYANGYCNSAGNFVGIGGTSASSPAFAGLMALINQKQGAAQGDPNFVLYKLAATQSASNCNSSSSSGPAGSCTFNDVTMGTIALPCVTSSPNCTTSTAGHQYGILSGYNAGTGYDLATGLGSVNANNLVNNWGNIKFTPSITALTLNGGNAVNVAHGSPISVNVSVTPASPAPTGDVSLIATQGNNTFGFDTMTLSGGGTASNTTNMLPGGSSYTVQAHYEGDKTYGGSYSTPVTVTVTPEPSATALRLITFDPTTGREINPNASSVVYGSPYLVRADVTNSSGATCVNTTNATQSYACPTGNVALTDNGGALNGGQFGLNSEGSTEDQTIQLTGGSHNLAANYSGDNSYKASSTTDAITVTPAPTSTTVNPPYFPQQVAIIAQPFGLSAVTTTQSNGAAPGGTYTAFDGTTQLTPTISAYGYPASSTGTAQAQGTIYTAVSGPAGPHTLTVQYSGDENYTPSTSAAITINALYPDTMSVTATPNSIEYGTGATMTLIVTMDTANPSTKTALKPTGSFSFIGGLDGNLTNPVTTNVTQDSSGNWELQATMTFTPQQSEFVTVKYSGDSNYVAVASGTAITVNIPDFDISSPNSLVIAAGQTGTETLAITPMTSYTSTVQLSCGGGFNIPGATCSISPSSVTLSNSTSATATLTITTLAPSSALSANTSPMPWHEPMAPLFSRCVWWTLSLLAGFSALALIVLPGWRRSVRAACGFGLVCLTSFVIGCGGGANASSSPPPPPASTTTMLSVANTKVAQSSPLTLTVNVNSSKSVTGTATVSSPNCNVASTGTLVNGSMQVTFNSILPAGTCTFSAHYFGDANNAPSQSGNLNIAITGSVSLQIIGQTSTLTHTIPVTVTIQ